MDGLAGEELEPAVGRRARPEDMAYIHNKKVWTVMQRDDAHRRRWKIIWKEGVQRQCGRRIVCCGRLSGGLRRLVSDAATVGPEDKDR